MNFWTTVLLFIGAVFAVVWLTRRTAPVNTGVPLRIPGLNFWTAALLFFGAIFLLYWLAGFPGGHAPLTGKDCIEVVSRMRQEVRAGKALTDAEQIDLEDCSHQ
jgi:hypothetical protein